MISHKHKCIFVHIPKCAGSSIEKFFVGRDWWNINKKTKHIHAKTAKKIYKDDWNEYFTFSFVRNPWDIMVSWYKWRRSHNLSFDKFLTEYKIKHKYADWLPETLYQTDFLLDENDNPLVNFIGRFENLQEDFNVVCDKIGIPHQQLPHTNKTKHKHYTEYYDDETKEIVAERCARDIEYFGYEFGED